MTGSASPAQRISVRDFDDMHDVSAATLLLDCCGSREWVRRLVARRPFVTMQPLLDAADDEWRALRPDDWLEAFRAHPRIGEQRAAGQSRESARMSETEQSAFARSGEAARAGMAALNAEYEERFGHIFIICAAGLSAAGIEAQLRSRLTNPPEHELRIAAEEQRKITRLRIERLLED